MKKYHKIPTVYERDPKNNHKTLVEGSFATPELAYTARSGWYFTEKVDGTNIRVIWHGLNELAENPALKSGLEIAGRNWNSSIPQPLTNMLFEMFPVERLAELYPHTPMTLYGEGYGDKIQKAGKKYIPDSISFILFDIKINDLWLERHNVHGIADALGVRTVPITGGGNLFEAVDMARSGMYSIVSEAGGMLAEGLVMRPNVELQDRRGNRIIAKVKYKDFAHG